MVSDFILGGGVDVGIGNGANELIESKKNKGKKKPAMSAAAAAETKF